MKIFLQLLLVSAFTLGIAACGDYEPPEGEDFPAQQDDGGDPGF